MFNEKPPEDELADATDAAPRAALPPAAVLHTSLGDITMRLHGEAVPKTVENFVTHARNGYFDGHLFHRIIKDFMLQTGEGPLGLIETVRRACVRPPYVLQSCIKVQAELDTIANVRLTMYCKYICECMPLQPVHYPPAISLSTKIAMLPACQ